MRTSNGSHTQASQARARVLVVDDFPFVAEGMAAAFAADPEIEIVGVACAGFSALAQARELRPDVVLADDAMRLGETALADRLRAELPRATTVLLTAGRKDGEPSAADGPTACVSRHASRAELRGVLLAAAGAAARRREPTVARRRALQVAPFPALR